VDNTGPGTDPHGPIASCRGRVSGVEFGREAPKDDYCFILNGQFHLQFVIIILIHTGGWG